MNVVIIMGRLTRDPDIRYSAGESSSAVARFSMAVDRRFKRDGQADADFFDCVAFGRQAEFVEKYLHQGTKMVVQGRLQNDNYTDRDGRKVYRNQIVVENLEFAESKAASQQNAGAFGGRGAAPSGRPEMSDESAGGAADGFMNIPDGIDEELPFT